MGSAFGCNSAMPPSSKSGLAPWTTCLANQRSAIPSLESKGTALDDPQHDVSIFHFSPARQHAARLSHPALNLFFNLPVTAHHERIPFSSPHLVPLATLAPLAPYTQPRSNIAANLYTATCPAPLCTHGHLAGRNTSLQTRQPRPSSGFTQLN